MQKRGKSKQVKKNATSCVFERFAKRNEASRKPTSWGGDKSEKGKLFIHAIMNAIKYAKIFCGSLTPKNKYAKIVMSYRYD